MTKTEQLQRGAIEIWNNRKDIYDGYEQFNKYISTQKLFKNQKRAQTLCSFFPICIIAETDKYKQKPRQKEILSQHQYIEKFEKYIWRIYECLLGKYGYVGYGADTTIIRFLGWSEKVLKKQYNKLYPEFAKADAILRAIVNLKSVNMDISELEQQFYSLTSNNKELMRELPFVHSANLKQDELHIIYKIIGGKQDV